MELAMLPPEKEIEVKPLDDERAAVFVFTEMTQVSRPRPPACLLDSVPGCVPGAHIFSSRSQLPPESVADEDGKKKKVILALVLALCHLSHSASQSLTSSPFTHRKSEKGNTTAHIILPSPPEIHPHHRTRTTNSYRCTATRPHRPPPRTSPHQVELRRPLTLPNVVLCERSATSLLVRRVVSHRVRNAARCVLSLTPPERAPLSHHHLRLPHSDESRSMESL